VCCGYMATNNFSKKKKGSEITGTEEREQETKPSLCSPQPVHGRSVQGL